MTAPRTLRRTTVAALSVICLTATLASCAESKRDETSSSDQGGGANDTFVFAASSDPVMLDPAFSSDGETFRVARQMFEGLTTTKPGTAEPAPLLAKSWTTSDDGLSYTFTLQDGVTFHDGEAFNADAVCANFDRWYNWTGINQSENISYYYNSLFKGFKNNEDESQGKALYDSCEATDDTTAVIKLTSPFATLPAALSLPVFAMQSPKALKEYEADNTGGDSSDPRFSEYATKHPTGTGPFKFDSWERGQNVTLKANADYWGEAPKVKKVVIRTMPDGNTRLQALKSGEVDAYDSVSPGDIEGLQADGYTVETRAPFTILYLGLNQATPALAKPKVRQAIAHAIDKSAVAKQSLPADTELATQFMPSTVMGYTDDVAKYEYDPEKAKQLLAEAGEENLTVRFNYPTGVSRPYMPTPEDTYVALKSQLEAVGITVEPVADKWSPDYLDKIQNTTEHDLHLLGWNGDYNSADNFLGVFFGQESSEWGFANPELFAALKEARSLASEAEQKTAFEGASKTIMEYLPGVPLAHPASSLALSPKVSGYQSSPVTNEVWTTVTVKE